MHRFRWELALLEDLHSGTGRGDGSRLDARHARDAAGFPVIRSSHWKGVLSDFAEELIALGRARLDDVHALFGARSELRGRLVCRSLSVLRDGKPPEDLVLSVSRTARALDHRGPREDTLRTVECLRAGTRLATTLELRESGDRQRDERLRDLLVDCIRQCDSLGAHRNRGDGALVTTAFQPQQPKPRTLPPRDTSQLRLTLLLRALDPVNLGDTPLPNNIIPTLPFVRGSALLGTLVGWYLEQPHGDEASARQRAQRWLDRDVLFGNALPLPRDLGPLSPEDLRQLDVVPIGQDIGTPKHQPAAQHQPWWAWGGTTDYLGARREESRFRARHQKRPHRTEFLFRSQPTQPWRRYRPLTAVHLRTAVERTERGRNEHRAIERQLFATEEIAEETLFVAHIDFPDAAAANAFIMDFRNVLARTSWLRVGRGGAPLEVTEVVWTRPEPAATRDATTSPCTVTLTSDLILRDESTLAYHRGLDPAAVRCLTGLTATELPDTVGDTDRATVTELGESEPVRGFNATMGMPRGADHAIRAGSTCRIDRRYSGAVRAKLAAKGAVGERTWEGYGRFRVDLHPLQDTPRPPPAPRDGTALAGGERLAAVCAAAAVACVELQNRLFTGCPPSQWYQLWEACAGGEGTIQATREALETTAKRLPVRPAAGDGHGSPSASAKELIPPLLAGLTTLTKEVVQAELDAAAPAAGHLWLESVLILSTAHEVAP